jgi:glycosyltransferase involved in cell wall biosynthesis
MDRVPPPDQVGSEPSRWQEKRNSGDFRHVIVRAAMDLSIIIPALDEEGCVGQAVSDVHGVCRGMGLDYEILVVDGGSRDRTALLAQQAGATVLTQRESGYGAALREGFAAARGEWVATMDSDLSHPPMILRTLYRNRERGDVLIASRYVKGGLANMPLQRRWLSQVLNRVFARVLDLPIADLSSGFRLYRRSVLREVEARHSDFSFLQEILVRAYCAGFRVLEIPFHYFPRRSGASKARIIPFGVSYLRLLRASRKLRDSTRSADYDERAYDSWILPQRWWQRARYRIVVGWADREGRVLDVGCGSSRIFEALPGAVGIDLDRGVLRYRRALGNPLVCASTIALPLRDASFDQLISSQVIEHVAHDENIFREFCRVLRPGGTLILGTPDYDRIEWRITEWIYGKVMPGAYAPEHITHYTLRSLRTMLDAHGFDVVDHRYVFRGELILFARKRGGA